jgi:hypothetical protein
MMPLTGTVSATDLNALFELNNAALLANNGDDGQDFSVQLWLPSLASGADVSLRSLAWTQPDDAQIQQFSLSAETDSAGRAIGATLTVDNGDTDFLMNATISRTLTTSNVSRTDSRSDSWLRGGNPKLLSGVRYRLTITNTSGGTVNSSLQASIQMRMLKRRR